MVGLKKGPVAPNPNPAKQRKGGNPPEEYRWVKGGPSPNPGGRPKKSHIRHLFAALDPIAAEMLEFDQRIVGIGDDGENLNNGDILMKLIKVLAKSDFRALMLWVEGRKEAYKDSQELRIKAYQSAIEHMELYGRLFELAEQQGKPVPNVLPHPADIILGPNLNFTIDGPVLQHDQRKLEKLLQHRGLMFEVVEREARRESRTMSTADAREMWAYLRRRFYRFHRRIPQRLYKPFPKFDE